MSQHTIADPYQIYFHLRNRAIKSLVERARTDVFSRFRVFFKLLFFVYRMKDLNEMISMEKSFILENPQNIIDNFTVMLNEAQDACYSLANDAKRIFPLLFLEKSLREQGDCFSDIVEDLSIMRDCEVHDLLSEIAKLR